MPGEKEASGCAVVMTIKDEKGPSGTQGTKKAFEQ